MDDLSLAEIKYNKITKLLDGEPFKFQTKRVNLRSVKCFSVQQVQDWLVDSKQCESKEEARTLVQKMMVEDIVRPVAGIDSAQVLLRLGKKFKKEQMKKVASRKTMSALTISAPTTSAKKAKSTLAKSKKDLKSFAKLVEQRRRALLTHYELELAKGNLIKQMDPKVGVQKQRAATMVTRGKSDDTVKPAAKVETRTNRPSSIVMARIQSFEQFSGSSDNPRTPTATRSSPSPLAFKKPEEEKSIGTRSCDEDEEDSMEAAIAYKNPELRFSSDEEEDSKSSKFNFDSDDDGDDSSSGYSIPGMNNQENKYTIPGLYSYTSFQASDADGDDGYAIPLSPRNVPKDAVSPKVDKHAGFRAQFVRTDTVARSMDPFSKILYENVDIESDVSGYNERFQIIMDRINASQITTNKIEENQKLINLAKDFLFTATAYGKIIISEVYVPNKEKTIQPVEIGGVAGGSKYMVQGVLFKFALDTEGLYGSDDASAATVAGHELKGLQAYFGLEIKRLSLPLMALVDYKGFRLVAISYLPINSKTLVYGTNDAGKTMHNDNAIMRDMMQEAAKILNLKPHMAGLQTHRQKEVYSAADVEGHVGTDKRYYLLDFARTFPPEPPQIDKPGINLTNLFRPEFVKSFKVPLCSDAYSCFTSTSHCKEVQEAYNHLQTVVIPECAKELPKLYNEYLKGALKKGIGLSTFIPEVVHSRGINLRHLGKLYAYFSTYEDSSNPALLQVKAALVTEIVARTLKSDLRKRFRQTMREFKKHLEQPFHALAINFLNLVFGNSAPTHRYWNNVISKLMECKFAGIDVVFANVGENAQCRATVGSLIADGSRSILSNWRWVVVSRLLELTKINLTPECIKQLKRPDCVLWKLQKPFHPSNLISISERIKHMNIISHAEGFINMSNCLAAMKSHKNEVALQHLKLAICKFEEVLNSTPYNLPALRSCATALLLEVELTKNSKKQRVARAKDYINRAINLDKTNKETLHMHACFLDKLNESVEAEAQFLLLLEIHPLYLEGLRDYVVFLKRAKKVDDAQKFREILVMLNKNREIPLAIPRLSNIT